MAARDLPPIEALSREQIAESLIRRRERLLRQLPRQIKLARRLTVDQHELVVDEATDWLVTQNKRVVADEDALEAAFWTAADLRVRRVFEGRYNTVRAGWKRVDVDDLEISAGGDTPEDTVIHQFERATLEEFATELSREEQAVLAVKYSGPKELGRVEIARVLGRKPHEIRRHERAIVRKLKAFSAILTAGKLCDERHESLEALALGRATPLDHRRALVHLQHCAPCRVEYTGLIRAIRSGQLPREIGQILPLPAIEAVERQRGPWEIIVDWCSRPFGHDLTITVTQLAPAGRALSMLAGAKIVTICIGGTAAIGGGLFCITQIRRDPPPPPPPIAREKPKERPRKVVVKPAKTVVAATPTATSTPKRERAPRKKRREGGEVSRDPTSHEKAAAISPPATAPGGEAVSEFEPGPATSAPTQPAAAPENGGPEFP